MSFDVMSREQLRAELGSRLRRARLDQNLTQAETAERAGLSELTVSKIERGRDASMDSFLSILRALGLVGRLELVLPEAQISPMAQLAADSPRQRVRASRVRGAERRASSTSVEHPWTWKDET